ncbi:MAG: sulfatase [Myxococcales bacterium]|nr:sulfatase [Myxococcales bacterium]
MNRTRRPRAWIVPALLVAGVSGACADREAAQPNLILVSIDTLRADRLGAYGYERNTSPHLDALAARGVRFETVIADSNWTLPAHVTLFTGLPPSFHGVTGPRDKMQTGIPTLTEVLKQHGYRTFGVTGGGFLDGSHGFDRGFDRYGLKPLDLRTALDLVVRVARQLAPEERYFWFVHTYDVHCPYHPPPRYARLFDRSPAADRIETRDRCGNPHYNGMALTPGQARFLSDRYDAGIRYADDLLGAFFERLESEGRLRNTIVVVVSDHGEEFLEHGQIGHRNTQFIESLRVPWIMAGPGLERRVVTQPAALADVMPTLLDLLGIPAPAVEGVSLLPFIEGRGADRPPRTLFSEDPLVDLYSAIHGGRHVIHRGAAGDPLLFDWRDDPREASNLFEAKPESDAELRLELDERVRRLADLRSRRQPEAAPVASEEQRERLRALGYVE